MSVCPSVHQTLRYRVCVLNFSDSFQWIFLKPCILVMDIMKTCIWVNRIYPLELRLNKDNVSDTEALFLDLHLSISDAFVKT